MRSQLTKPNLSAEEIFVGLHAGQVYKAHVTNITDFKSEFGSVLIPSRKMSETRNDLSVRCNEKCRSGDIDNAESPEKRKFQMLIVTVNFGLTQKYTRR
jgi:NAD-specific glutamate dehydrogenase